jgi:hypothetical protein
MTKIAKWTEDYGQYKQGDILRLEDGAFAYFKETGKIEEATEAEEKKFLKKEENQPPLAEVKPGGYVERAEVETPAEIKTAEVKTDKKK